MAKILFKKGTWANLQANVINGSRAVDGALYLTEDEGGLYLGKSNGTVKRISGSVLYFSTLDEFSQNVQPPYSTDVIYFLADRDALVRWNGSEWIVLNQTAESVNTALQNLQDQITTNTNNINKVTTTANGALQTSGGTMSGSINMGGQAITNLATPSANTDAATKKYVDDKDAALLGASGDASTKATIHGALTGIGEAKQLANAAQDAAEAADTKAGNAASRAEEMLPLDGSKAMQANLDAGNYNVINVAAPTANGHATNKKYVDDQVKVARDEAAVADEKAANAASAAAAAQSTADQAMTNAATAQAKANSAYTAAENADANAETRVLKSDFEAFKTSNASAIEAAKKAGDDAQAYAEAVEDVVEKHTEDLAKKLNLSGGTMTGNIAMSTNKITGLGAPSADADAATKKYVDEAKASATAAATSAKNAADAADAKAVAAKAAADAAQDSADNAQQEVDALETVVAGVKDTAEKAVEDAAAANANADNRVLTTTFNEFKASNTTRINEVEAAAGAAQATADAALPKSGGTMTGAIAMGGNKITGLATPEANGDAATKGYVDDEVAAAKTYAEQLVASNDAMTFIGVINSDSDLPTAAKTSKRGDTYKVGTKGTYNGVEAKVGDLFINTAADDAVPVWEHVSSGYEDDYLQKLKYDSSTGKIYLTDGVTETYVANAALGAFLFTGDAETNLKLSVSQNSAHTEYTITATMEWGSF